MMISGGGRSEGGGRRSRARRSGANSATTKRILDGECDFLLDAEGETADRNAEETGTETVDGQSGGDANNIPIGVAEGAIANEHVERLHAGRILQCVGEGFDNGGSVVEAEGGSFFAARKNGHFGHVQGDRQSLAFGRGRHKAQVTELGQGASVVQRRQHAGRQAVGFQAAVGQVDAKAIFGCVLNGDNERSIGGCDWSAAHGVLFLVDDSWGLEFEAGVEQKPALFVVKGELVAVVSDVQVAARQQCHGAAFFVLFFSGAQEILPHTEIEMLALSNTFWFVLVVRSGQQNRFKSRRISRR